ncbi:MAG: cytochrome ubiquinol oxidase subunit I, partial [Phycisphaeraceae bacterium]
LPDTETGEMKWDLAVPGLLSFFMHGDFSTPVAGLDQFPQEQWPPVLVSFASYHIMVALGMYFIFITLLALFFRVRQTLFQKRWLLWIFVFSVVGPFIANEIGWVAAEVGRQPWSVYPEVNWSADGTAVSYDTSTGLLTADAASTNLSPGQVIGSITMFSLIYLLLLGIWLFVLNHKIQAGPEPVRLPDRTTPRGFREATTGRTTHHESMTEAKEADQENEPR